MFENIDFIFLQFKIYQKLNINLQTKLKHIKKMGKKIAILIYPPLGIFRKKKLIHKSCIFSQKIQQKSFFLKNYLF
jgi:hypothetical protein